MKVIKLKFLLFVFVFSYILLVSCSKENDDNVISTTAELTPVVLQNPQGFPKMIIPADNPLTKEGIALGKMLFYDNILSANYSMNCGSCHAAEFGFTDNGWDLSTGIDKVKGTRNSMPIFNLGWNRGFFWDGGARDLESQVIGPIQNPVEMHLELSEAISRLNSHKDYPLLFKKVFGSEKITSAQLMKAIAQFERTIISVNSRYDKYIQGKAILSTSELKGLSLFQDFKRGDCNHCHSLGGNFTDYEFRNTGLDSVPIDKGRALITKNEDDEGKFKTPSLRNLDFTAPYMHDGRFKTLEECINHYNTNFKYTKNLDANLIHAKKGRLSNSDVQDIVAFLKTLNDIEFVNNKEYQK